MGKKVISKSSQWYNCVLDGKPILDDLLTWVEFYEDVKSEDLMLYLHKFGLLSTDKNDKISNILKRDDSYKKYYNKISHEFNENLSTNILECVHSNAEELVSMKSFYEQLREQIILARKSLNFGNF